MEVHDRVDTIANTPEACARQKTKSREPDGTAPASNPAIGLGLVALPAVAPAEEDVLLRCAVDEHTSVHPWMEVMGAREIAVIIIAGIFGDDRSEEHTSELQSRFGIS